MSNELYGDVCKNTNLKLVDLPFFFFWTAAVTNHNLLNSTAQKNNERLRELISDKITHM